VGGKLCPALFAAVGERPQAREIKVDQGGSRRIKPRKKIADDDLPW
jgi:hypothetical protein